MTAIDAQLAKAPPPLGRISAAERRATIALAAGRLFARHGYAGTRLDDVAAAAGVTKPIVYRHFASKKDLYLALLAKHEEDLPGFVAGAAEAAQGVSPELLVRRILDHWLDYVRENQHAWVMLFRDGSGDDEIRARRIQVSERAREVLAGFVGVLAGERIPPAEVEPVAELLTSGLAGLVLWWIDNPTVPKEVVLDAATRVCAPVVGPITRPAGAAAPGA